MLTIKLHCLREVQLLGRIFAWLIAVLIALFLAIVTEQYVVRPANVSAENKLTVKEQIQFLMKTGFKPNGCSQVPDFNFGEECCNVHDMDYYTKEVTRAEADKKLRECIRAKGYFLLPWIYWVGVRLFGGKYYGRNTPAKTDEIYKDGGETPPKS